MDPRKPYVPPQMPFYLTNPSRTRFVPTPEQPLSLTQQLNAFREELSDELADDKLPRSDKRSTLGYFLGGTHKKEMKEMIADVELAKSNLKNSSGDCTLQRTVENMRTCYLSKELVPLSNTQLKAFTLQATPDMPIFPSEVRTQVDLLDDDEKAPNPNPGETKDGKKSTNVECAVGASSRSFQESFQSPEDTSAQPEAVVAVPSISGLSGTVFPRQRTATQNSRKSVAAALKGVRTSGRGRGRGRPPGRGGNSRRIGGQVGANLSQNSTLVQMKAAPMPFPSSSTNVSCARPASSSVPNDEPISIISLDGLKMKFKINRPDAIPPPAPPPIPMYHPPSSPSERSFLSLSESESDSSCQDHNGMEYSAGEKSPEKLICRIRLSKEQIAILQRKRQELEEAEEERLLDIY